MQTATQYPGLDRLSLSILGYLTAGGGRLTLSELARKAWRYTADERARAVVSLIDSDLAKQETIPAIGRRGPDPKRITLTPRGKRLFKILRKK